MSEQQQKQNDNLRHIRESMRENRRRSLIYTLSVCAGVIVIIIVACVFLIDFSQFENENVSPKTKKNTHEQIYSSRIATGKMFMEQGDLASAADHFNAALEFVPNDLRANMLLAECYYRNCTVRYRHCNKAMDQFDLILDFDPENAEVYFWLAKCQLRKRNYEGAMESFDAAIEFDKENPNYYQARSSLKMSLGDTLGAFNDLDKMN
jgi:Tfp pilus assembly protein PilF